MATFTWQELSAAIQDREHPLGAGGYGTVYRGCVRGLPVAIKVLNDDSQQGQREFEREVLVLGGLHHDHLLPLLGSCPERQALVYPLMEGGSLEERMRPDSRHGPLSWQARVRISHEVSLALLWLHTQPKPIIHMDLKPANVLLDRFGTAKVADVGLANMQSTGVAHTIVQQSSKIKGTVGYMAPEYFLKGLLGPSTDVYSLGVVMCQLLTGKEAGDATDTLGDAFEDTPAAALPAALCALSDPAAAWPEDVAVRYANLAAACIKPHKPPHKKRPGLQEVLLPGLQAMAATAAGASAAAAVAVAVAGSSSIAAATNGVGGQGKGAVNSDCSLMMSLECPICHETLDDPVSTPGGLTFCRLCITSWLQKHTTCPTSRQPLTVQQLVPNYALRGVLEKLVKLSEVAHTSSSIRDRQQPATSEAPSAPPLQLHGAAVPAAVAPASTSAQQPRPPAPAAAASNKAGVSEAERREQLESALAVLREHPCDAVAKLAVSVCLQQLFGPKVIMVDLRGFRLGDAGVTALAQHAAHCWPQLAILDLRGNDIRAAGVTALAEHAAQHWPQLQELELGFNYIGDAGVTALARHAAQHWPQLQHLELGFNNIGDAGVTALAQHAAQHWPQLQTLFLHNNNIGDAGVTGLAQHAAQHWPQLQTLFLHSNNIGDAGVTALTQHAAGHWIELRTLDLTQNNVGPAGRATLAQCAASRWPPRYRHRLHLYLGEDKEGEVEKEEGEDPWEEGEEPGEDGDEARISTVLQSVQDVLLDVLDVLREQPCDAAAKLVVGVYLRQLYGLEAADIGLCNLKLGDAGVTALAQHAARHWPQLQYLNLDSNNIGDAGVTALAQHAAWHWPQLRHLDLSNNNIGDAGVTALAQHAAWHWPQLRHLDLGSNNIGAAGVTALAQHAAQHWPQLQTLFLHTNNIGDAGVTALAEHAAQHWPQLQKLYLSCHKIGAAGVTALAQHAAQHWPQLQHLYLCNNFIGDAGVTALAQHAAQHWPQLRGLSLRSNNIGDAGVTALAQHAAPHWQELWTLDLEQNRVGPAGRAALAQCAATHWPELIALRLD